MYLCDLAANNELLRELISVNRLIYTSTTGQLTLRCISVCWGTLAGNRWSRELTPYLFFKSETCTAEQQLWI